MSEQISPSVSPEHMYEVHKTDVKAMRELGGLAFVGLAEPSAPLSARSEYLLSQASGDVHIAAGLAKQEAERINNLHGQIVAENLDQLLPEANEWNKIHDLQKEGPALLEDKSLYELRRERGVPLGGDETRSRPLGHLEAAIDPRTGSAVLPLGHRVGYRSRYSS